MAVEIPKTNELEQKVFTIDNAKDFSSIALEVYHFQYANNNLYRQYCDAVYRTPQNVHHPDHIPFLPISFFKTHRVMATSFEPQLVFTSSGTTGSITSAHYIKDPGLYKESFGKCFNIFYGDPGSYCILGLLPSYLERGQSSLVYMVDTLIKDSGHIESGFYLHDFDRLDHTLRRLERAGQKTILIGVTYALLDFAAQFPQKLHHTTVMETGGMKGRGREITRPELYEQLKGAFGIREIHSEYGMTELLSQAYAVDGRFKTPPWMKVVMRDETDPFAISQAATHPQTGAINVTDLANLYSCSFIATEDIGRSYPDGSFEVLGRMDNTDIRGCSLLSL